MKIPFDIKFRPQIESGEYKVETFSGCPVTIYRWDFEDGARTPIMGSYVFEDNKEYVGAWDEEGHFDLMSPNDLDLFIITPEPELSEFEVALEQMMYDWEDKGIEARKIVAQHINDIRRLAREEIIKSGYAIVESEHYLEEGRKNYERGKEDALKDLPRWRKWENGACGNGRGIPLAIVKRGLYGYELVDALGIQGEQYIMLSDLEKLPGFNE